MAKYRKASVPPRTGDQETSFRWRERPGRSHSAVYLDIAASLEQRAPPRSVRLDSERRPYLRAHIALENGVKITPLRVVDSVRHIGTKNRPAITAFGIA